MKRWMFLVCAVFLTQQGFCQFLEKEPSISLAPKEILKPEIFDLDFMSPPAEVLVDMKRLGVQKAHEVELRNDIMYQIYNGTPPFGVEGLTSYMKFYNQRLIGMNFRFQTDFSTYLILKNRLLEDLGNRYTVEKDKSHMDPFLKSELAYHSGGTISPELDQKIKESILEGKTVFYLPFKDKENKIDASLYWTRSSKTGQTILGLSYVWLEGEKAIEDLKKSEEAKRSVLPK